MHVPLLCCRTAHVATSVPAKGSEPSNAFGPAHQYSKRDIPSFRTLKERQPGQGAPSEVKKRDLKADLEQRERLAGKRSAGSSSSTASLNEQPPEALLGQAEQSHGGSSKVQRLAPDPADADDGDDDEGGENVAANNPDDEDEDDDEDDEDELMAELERVKQERAEQRERTERERTQQQSEQERQSALAGNPLMGDLNNATSTNSIGSDSSFAIKRRWYEEVPFRNTAQNEPVRKKRFINDTIRSEFHQNFLRKYVR